MRVLFSLLVVLSCLFPQNVDLSIQKSQAKIQKNIKAQNRISAKIKDLGNQITSQNNELKVLTEEIQILEKEIEDNQGKFLKEQEEFQNAKLKSEELHRRNASIQSQITKLIAQELAFRVIVNDRQPVSPDDIILSELFKTLNQNAKTSIASLSEEKKKIAVEMDDISKKLQVLQVVIKRQNEKRTKLESDIKKRNTLIAKLERDLEVYDHRLSKIAQERKNLDEILEKFNIRKQKEQKRFEDEQKTQIAKKERLVPLDVRRMGSSYRQVSTTHYRGKKISPPLDFYKIDQRFGTYFDPVYKIKVFNESVILSPKEKNANVKNVMDGKVVFAKETPVLKKVVIIEHANSIHTIYAYLDKIAPTIRPGLRIKKGYIVGKVDERLGFEVTQKDKHIDPLELIGE